jgi:hypothetical protein
MTYIYEDIKKTFEENFLLLNDMINRYYIQLKVNDITPLNSYEIAYNYITALCEGKLDYKKELKTKGWRDPEEVILVDFVKKNVGKTWHHWRGFDKMVKRWSTHMHWVEKAEMMKCHVFEDNFKENKGKFLIVNEMKAVKFHVNMDVLFNDYPTKSRFVNNVFVYSQIDAHVKLHNLFVQDMVRFVRKIKLDSIFGDELK